MAQETPEQKADIAHRTMLVYSSRKDNDTLQMERDVTDLLCDLMHLLDSHGFTIDDKIAEAKLMYNNDLATVKK